MDATTKHVIDGGAVATAAASFFTTWVPAIAALLSAIWIALRIYETILDIQKKRRL